MKYILIFLISLGSVIKLQAQLNLLWDANSTGYSRPSDFCLYNGNIYFQASTKFEGTELWRSDGTSAGTLLFKDIFGGNSTYYPYDDPNDSNPSEFVVYKDKLYFFANREDIGSELWQSDGTSTGTVLFKDIAPGKESSAPRNLTVCNNNLYFSAQTTATGPELWVTDGTESGTVLVKDIYPGSLTSGISGIAALHDKIFFAAMDVTSFKAGGSLWVSDGTEMGTTVLKQLNIITYTWQGKQYPFTLFNDELYFNVLNGPNYELWKTNGTTAGTVFVQKILSQATNMTVFKNRLYFVVGNSTSDAYLYSTDGIPNNAAMVAHFQNRKAHADYWGVPTNIAMIWGLTEYKNRLFFQAKNLTSGAVLWETNGIDSIGLVHDFREGRTGGDEYVVNYVYDKMSVANNKLYMSADDGIHGTMIWEYTYQPIQMHKINNDSLHVYPTYSGVDIVAYPNPASDIITIASTLDNEVLKVVCKNSLGATVYIAEPKNSFYEMIVSNFATGFYTLEIYTADNRTVKKIQVIK